jgi:protease-4
LLKGLFVMVLGVSLLLNLYLLVAVAALSGMGLQERVLREGEDDQVVAVWTVSGAIMGDSVEAFRRFHHTVVTTPEVKAVVLRVDSPGGGVAASDEIHAMVRDLRNRMPVVVSMGSLAASGGYYISAPANEIFAEHGTATGSIGVIAQIPNVGGTAEKIGLEMQIVKSSNAEYWKDMLSPYRQMQPRERKRLKEILDAMQTRFEAVVADGRGDRLNIRERTFEVTLPNGETAIRTETAPFNGMVYTAAEAQQMGLVDTIGYESDAMDKAAALAGLGDPTIVRFDLREPLLSTILGQSPTSALDMKVELLEELRTPRFMYLCTLP